MSIKEMKAVEEKNLLERKIVGSDNTCALMYNRNQKRHFQELSSYTCNLCKKKCILGQKALFEHNKSSEHVQATSKNEKQKATKNMVNEVNFSKNIVQDAIDEVHQNYARYRATPASHPEYANEWRRFWIRRKNVLIADNCDPFQYNFSDEWQSYWMNRHGELFDEAIKSAKKAVKSNERDELAITPGDTVFLSSRSNSPKESLEDGELTPTPKQFRNSKSYTLPHDNSKSLKSPGYKSLAKYKDKDLLSRQSRDYKSNRNSASTISSGSFRSPYSRSRSRSRCRSRHSSRRYYRGRYRDRSESENFGQSAKSKSPIKSKKTWERGTKSVKRTNDINTKICSPSKRNENSSWCPMNIKNIVTSSTKTSTDNKINEMKTSTKVSSPHKRAHTSQQVPSNSWSPISIDNADRYSTTADKEEMNKANSPQTRANIKNNNRNNNPNNKPNNNLNNSNILNVMKSNDNDLLQFYDKKRLPLIVQASTRIHEYNENKNSSETEPLFENDMILMATQISNMLAFKGFDPKTLPDDEAQSLIDYYVAEMKVSSTNNHIIIGSKDNSDSDCEIVSVYDSNQY